MLHAWAAASSGAGPLWGWSTRRTSWIGRTVDGNRCCLPRPPLQDQEAQIGHLPAGLDQRVFAAALHSHRCPGRTGQWAKERAFIGRALCCVLNIGYSKCKSRLFGRLLDQDGVRCLGHWPVVSILWLAYPRRWLYTKLYTTRVETW